MAAGASKQQIANALRRLKRKNPTETYVVLRASNGEVAIVTQAYLDSVRGSRDAKPLRA